MKTSKEHRKIEKVQQGRTPKYWLITTCPTGRQFTVPKGEGFIPEAGGTLTVEYDDKRKILGYVVGGVRVS